jgi:hypothetical protein
MGVALRHGNLQPNSNHLSDRQLRIAGSPFWPTLNFLGLQKVFRHLFFFVLGRSDLFSNINKSQINLFASFLRRLHISRDPHSNLT